MPKRSIFKSSIQESTLKLTLNKTELFHVFFIYQEIFIRKYVLEK